MLKKLLKGLVSASMVLSMAVTSVAASETGVATGTQTPYVTGEDWGCGVSKTVIALDKTIDAASVAKTDFTVVETKAGMFGATTADRTVLDAYVSDATGNKVTTDSNYVTVEMYISPEEGGAAVFSLQTWRNAWCTPYQLDVQLVEGQSLSSKGETINTLEIAPDLDLQKMICPQLNGFALYNDGFESSDGHKLSYAVYTPAQDNHKNALVVWNHGIGETGTDVKIDLLCNEVTALGGSEFQKVMGGAYVLVPQRRIGMDSTENEAVFELIQKTVAENPDIDPNRVIVAGCSAGGKCTVDLINNHADYFAAAVPICAAGGITAETIAAQPALKTLPIFWIHSQDDDTVPFASTTGNIEALKAAGNTNMHLYAPEHVYSNSTAPGYPETYSGHWSWVDFDNNAAKCGEDGTNCWTWMAQQAKTPITAANGTAQVVVTGDDWGCGVSKVVVTLDATIDPVSVEAKDFVVVEEKPWYGTDKAQFTRKVLNAYTCDEKGNKVEEASTKVAVELYISPDEGSPMIYTGRNNWVSFYNIYVTLAPNATLTAGENVINALNVNGEIKDIATERLCPQLDGYTFGTYTDENGGTTSYALYAPKADNHTNALLMWNHGAGEYGTDVQIDLLCNEVTAYSSEEFQAIMDGAYVLVPQRRWGGDESTTTKTVAELIQKVLAENPDIDPNRVIETGCSAGGMFTLQMEIDYPELFAAAAPICPAKTITAEEAKIIKDIPNWFIHAENDTTVKPASSHTGIELLKAEGAEVHMSFFEDVHDTTGRFVGEDGEPYQYAGHWSWIYADNNECNCDECKDLNCWEWMAQQCKVDVVEGTQTKVVIEGEDWGPSVSKVIIKVKDAVKAADIDVESFKVYETKEATNWANLSVYNATATRKVVDVYLSDAKGNKVEAEEGTTITVEMYISPNDGSPFRYDVPSGSNKWCEPYVLNVEGIIGAAKVVSEKSYTLKGGEEWINDLAHSFDVTKSYTAKDGYTYAYGEYTPAKDDKQNALVIWLHGAGEGMATDTYDNDNYVDILGNEVTAYVDEEFQSLFEGAYVITPQAPTMWMAQPDTMAYPTADETDIRSVYAEGLFELIQNYVANNPDVDPNRVIIGGCSNGGYMTMHMIIDHPDFFYKAFPICEAYYDNAITDAEIKALADSGMGIWFTYALTDTTVDPTITAIPTIKRLQEAGADVHYTEWAKVEDLSGRFDTDGVHHEYSGHWSWIYFDNNENTTCNVHGEENEWVWLAQYEKATPENPGTEGGTTGGNTTGGTTTNPSKPNVGIYNNAAYAAVATIALAGAAYVAFKKKED